MNIIDAAMSRGRTVLLGLITVFIAGIAAYVTVQKEAEPDIEIPLIYIYIQHDGISPEDAVRLLVRPMEQELRTIEGIKEMISEGFEGGASVRVEFEAGVDTDKALQDVREKVDMAEAELPEGSEEPTVNEVKMSRFDPMLVLNIAGNVPERTLTRIAKDLKEEFEGLGGVLEVNLVGVREELMEVIVDPLAMESYGLDQAQIISFISRNNRLVAAGSMQASEGRFPVKVPGVFETAGDVLDMPIKAVGDRVVHFKDIAEVRRTYKDAESYARLNGKPALAMEVVQRGGANLIEAIDEVMAIVERERQQWPGDIEVSVSRDKSKDVNDMLTELQNSVIAAVLLVFIVIIGILGMRSALLVGVSIPGSFLLGILLIGAFGSTINMMVLFALIMAVGLLVDGAIVVTEMADRRLAEGDSRLEAYSRAAARMSWPIIASTCTTLAAFVPLALWPGTSGEFMKYLPLTLIAVPRHDHRLHRQVRAIPQEVAVAPVAQRRDRVGAVARGLHLLFRFRSRHGVFPRRRAAVRDGRHPGAWRPVDRRERPARKAGRGAHPRDAGDRVSLCQDRRRQRYAGPDRLADAEPQALGRAAQGGRDPCRYSPANGRPRRHHDRDPQAGSRSTHRQTGVYRIQRARPGAGREHHRAGPCRPRRAPRRHEHRGRTAAARHRVADQGRPRRGGTFRRRHHAGRRDGAAGHQRHPDRRVPPGRQ
jgi:hypothetical protein